MIKNSVSLLFVLSFIINATKTTKVSLGYKQIQPKTAMSSKQSLPDTLLTITFVDNDSSCTTVIENQVVCAILNPSKISEPLIYNRKFIIDHESNKYKLKRTPDEQSFEEFIVEEMESLSSPSYCHYRDDFAKSYVLKSLRKYVLSHLLFSSLKKNTN